MKWNEMKKNGIALLLKVINRRGAGGWQGLHSHGTSRYLSGLFRKIGLQHFRCAVVLGGPWGFREVRDVNRNNFHHFRQKRSGGFRAMNPKQKSERFEKQRLLQCERGWFFLDTSRRKLSGYEGRLPLGADPPSRAHTKLSENRSKHVLNSSKSPENSKT